MAARDSFYQSSNKSGGLEAHGTNYNPPLLPYEKELIQVIGCSEEEYKKFVRHATIRSVVRPAEYAHIPDIQNVDYLVYVGISLAIGAVSTAASILLAPKPPDITTRKRKQVTTQNLPDQVGPSRFNQASSFDSVAALSEYGDVIPVPFGKPDTGADGEITGGLALAPSLLWSRLFSFGTYQMYKAIYVAGQYGVSSPSIRGVWLGTNSINTLGKRDYALYWSSGEGTNRVTRSDLFAGSDGALGTGNPDQADDPFLCPTALGEFDQGFSMAYTPSTNSQFGAFSAIHNGSSYRFNWEILSAPFQTFEDNDDARETYKLQRTRMNGKEANIINLGQPGLGRAYGRQMGLVAHNGVQYEDKTRVTVAVGDTVIFRINDNNESIKERAKADNLDKAGLSLDDLISSANSWRERAEGLLTVGSRWIIGSTVWVLVGRPSRIYLPGSGTMDFTLECVSLLGVKEIGIAGNRAVTEVLGGYEGKTFNPNKHCGAAFFNICSYQNATIRNIRQADVVEIGLRSRVFNKASGLCNFNDVPTPAVLFTADKDNVKFNNPRMSKYFARTSCFSIWVRPIDDFNPVDGDAPTDESWSRLPQLFCITGRSPVDQYNFIRLRPRIQGRYEYRFIPRTGSDVAIYSDRNRTVWQLNAQTGAYIGEDFETAHGAFRVTFVGNVIPIEQIIANDELLSAPPGGPTLNQDLEPTQVANTQINTDSGTTNMAIQAWCFEVLGSPASVPGQTIATNISLSRDGGAKTMELRVFATSRNQSGALYREITGTSLSWQSVGAQVLSSTGSYVLGDFIGYEVSLPFNNVFRQEHGYKGVSLRFTVTELGVVTGQGPNPSNEQRQFEEASQVSDLSHYLELEKSNESGPEHTIVYVNELSQNETLADYEDLSVVGLSIRSGRNTTSISQLRLYTPEGIKVTKLNDSNALGASNLFSDLVFYLLRNESQGLGKSVPEDIIDTASLVSTGNFFKANYIFYDGVLDSPTNIRSFLSDTAPLLLCNFVVKNGKFGLQPALPTDESGNISTGAISVEQIFTAGNIIDGSLKLNFIDADQRQNFKAVVRYRLQAPYDLTQERSVFVEWADLPKSSPTVGEEEYDLTTFCTNREQALKTARFLMSLRRYVDHTITFQTSPDGLGIGPGSYIRVYLQSLAYSSASNGVINAEGGITSVNPLADGDYAVFAYRAGDDAPVSRTLTIFAGATTQSELFNSMYSLEQAELTSRIYQVEQVSLNEDSICQVSATVVPTTNAEASQIAVDVVTAANFTVLE
jgi:hypothetical protein